MATINKSSLQLLEGKPTPLVKYHRKSNNPYFYRYGDTWLENLRISLPCIISDGSVTWLEWSVQEDHFLVHDVLQLITVKTTIMWMRKNQYLYRWLLPFNLMQDGMPYVGHPIGHSPNCTPLDNSLNIYILQSLTFHWVLSLFVLKDEGNDEKWKNEK